MPTEDGRRRLIVAGSGFAGLVAALAASEAGLAPVVFEKGAVLGGATALSGGQVWVPGNHVAEREGVVDDVDTGIEYVRAISGGLDTDGDTQLREWLTAAPEVTRWLEDIGALRWETIPDFPDYYEEAPGSRSTGRFLTAAPFDTDGLDQLRSQLPPPVHYPSGISYQELFAWGGMSGRRLWDHDVLAERQRRGTTTFGLALVASLAAALQQRGVPIHLGTAVEQVEMSGARVDGAIVVRGRRRWYEPGAVVLATGSYDSDPAQAATYSAIDAEHAGSVAPATLTGDGIRVGVAIGGHVQRLAPTAAARLPGYRVAPVFPGDTGDRQCHEHGLPHAIVVNRRGLRFCDDSFPTAITQAVLSGGGADEPTSNVPFFMVWDDQHRQKYGLGAVPPGGSYDAQHVVSANTLEGVAAGLGIAPAQLTQTVRRYNEFADEGVDPDFGRGSRPWAQKFKGDMRHRPNANIGPLVQPPFYGMRLRLMMAGIPAAGLAVGPNAVVRGVGGRPVAGLYAVGAATALAARGESYHSGFSLSSGMVAGALAARHAAAAR